MSLPQIKKSELANLHQKVILYNRTIDPKTGAGNPALLNDINSYAKLVMRRHRISEKEYQINPQTGEIVKRVKYEPVLGGGHMEAREKKE